MSNGYIGDVRLLDASGNPIAAAFPVTITEAVPTTSTLTTKVAAAVDTSCIASNANRRELVICNDSSSATMYLSLGAGAAVVGTGISIPPKGFLSLKTTQAIRAIWTAADGSTASFLELTP